VSDKTAPAGPLRDPLPPVYPIPLIEVACRALEVLNGSVDPARGGAVGTHPLYVAPGRALVDGIFLQHRVRDALVRDGRPNDWRSDD